MPSQLPLHPRQNTSGFILVPSDADKGPLNCPDSLKDDDPDEEQRAPLELVSGAFDLFKGAGFE